MSVTPAERARNIFSAAKKVEAIKSGHPASETPVSPPVGLPTPTPEAEKPKMTEDQLAEILQKVVITPAAHPDGVTAPLDQLSTVTQDSIDIQPKKPINRKWGLTR